MYSSIAQLVEQVTVNH